MAELGVSIFFKVVSAVIANRNALSRSTDDVVKDLKFIRFDDEGVLSLVHTTLDGREIGKEELRKVLSGFNDQEWNVAAAVERLSAEAVREVKGISRLTSRELDRVKEMKLSVRKDVQRALNDYGLPGFKVNKRRLRAIVSKIERLNAAIDEAEDMLQHGRRHS